MQPTQIHNMKEEAIGVPSSTINLVWVKSLILSLLHNPETKHIILKD